MSEASRTILPATPGHYVILPIKHADGRIEHDRVSVIAWMLSVDACSKKGGAAWAADVTAVTPEGGIESSKQIIWKDGQYFRVPSVGSWATSEELNACLLKDVDLFRDVGGMEEI